jgi:DNA-binding MarR family transcriptional regulator
VGKLCAPSTEGLISPPQAEAMFGFLVSHATLTRRVDAVMMSRHKLSFSEFEVLCRVKDGEPISVRQVAEQLVSISRTRASRVVQDLIDRGYLRRSADQGDGRISLISFTAEGEAFAHQAAETFEEAVHRYFVAPLDDKDIAALNRIWAKLEDAEAR